MKVKPFRAFKYLMLQPLWRWEFKIASKKDWLLGSWCFFPFSQSHQSETLKYLSALKHLVIDFKRISCPWSQTKRVQLLY